MSTDTDQKSNNPEFNQRMNQLGLALKEYQEFFWTGILLFFLIVPLIILLVKYVKYLIALNNVASVHPDQNLKNASLFLWIAFAINIGGSSFAIGEPGIAFLNIGSFILTLLAYMKLEEWVGIVSRDRNSPSFSACKDGFSEMKIASILMFVIIGIFMISGAMKKTWTAILAEFGSIPQAGQQMGTQPQTVDNNVQPQKEIEQTPNFCRACGSKITIPDAIMCPNCGVSLK